MRESFLIYALPYFPQSMPYILDLIILFWAWEYILERSLRVDARRIEREGNPIPPWKGHFTFL